MKVHCIGSRFHGGQVDRIEDGFRQLGHRVTDHLDADLVYVNNPWYDQVLADRAAGRLQSGCKVIFNVLDIPLHIPDYDIARLRTQLLAADAVTCISDWTRRQVAEKCGIQATVVWNPLKPVSRTPEARQQPFYRFASIGRRSDPNKNTALWVAALQMLGYSADDVCLVGNEGGWGDYQGVLSDANLNVVYNSVDFVMCTGKVEGLNLPLIEAMAAGAVPVVATHLTTLEELLPARLFPEYQSCQPHPEALARFISTYANDADALAGLKHRLHRWYLASWRERTSPVGVADRILHVWKGLH